MTPIPPLKKRTSGQKIAELMQLLQRLPPDKATPELFDELCAWISDLPTEQRPDVLFSTLAQVFGKSVEEVSNVLRAAERRTEFDPLVPKTGWLHDYVEWTRQTEPPTVFHFFVGAAMVGTTLGRNVFFDKGAYQVFPNLCIMIIAPTGRCRKTSACNLGTSLFVKCGGTLLADKATPEAFVDALKGNTTSVGLIYAPELAVFLGKQKYNEGMIPLLTSLLDCPTEWTSRTLGRGETTLSNVALSALMCSTIDWIQTGIPRDAFGGGFMSRFLFVVQETTTRVFPLPPPLSLDVRKGLESRLSGIRFRKGTFVLSNDGESWYRSWYNSKASSLGDKQYAGYFERKPDHILRLAMILRVAEMEPSSKDYVLTPESLQHAERILAWLEQRLPSTFEEMAATAAGEDQARIMRQLRAAGGSMEHSSLLRRNSSKLNAEQFKRCVATLREAKLVEWDSVTRTYFLTSEGWK